MEDDTYLSLKESSTGLYKVKGSKHFSFAFPVTSESEIKEHLAKIRILHQSSRHHCYAWRLGHDALHFRTNDDGEPANTAGPPILGVLKSHSLTNVLIIVVRYFGGTKLGVGGLIEAYRTAASYSVSSENIIECVRTQTYLVKFPYAKMGAVMNILKRANISPTNTDFQISCSLEAVVRLRDSAGFFEKFSDLEDVVISEVN